MAELQSLLETLGLSGVKTYIQSGNVLFKSNEDKKQLCQRIEVEIKNVFGLTVPVMIRTASELQQIVNNCPFRAEELAEGENIHVAMLAESPSGEKIDYLYSLPSVIDDFHLKGLEIYVLFRQQTHKSKLPARLQKLGVPITLRNWKTMNKLVSMAEAME